MNADNEEICRANFQQVPLVHFFFMKFSQHCCETSVIEIPQRKVKNIFLDKNFKKSLYYRNSIGQTFFLAVNLIFK